VYEATEESSCGLKVCSTLN